MRLTINSIYNILPQIRRKRSDASSVDSFVHYSVFRYMQYKKLSSRRAAEDVADKVKSSGAESRSETDFGVF